MTCSEQIADFVAKTEYPAISDTARLALKIRVLDSLGCSIAATRSNMLQSIRAHIEEFGGARLCSLIGGGYTAPDRAAFYNSALVRYLDFNDSYLAKNETCHPSDNLGAVLAACEYADRTGVEFLTALAIAYQVQCRLSDAAPVRGRGFDHTTQGSYAVAAGVSKALGLDRRKTAHALAICGAAFNALRVTRTGTLSNWKGLAYPNTAFCGTHATFLAMRGITGPLEVFEGNKGFMDVIAGRFHIDWSKEDLERVTRTIVKRYNAEIHSQSAIEGALELRNLHGFPSSAVERVDIEIFDVAYRIIGGGEEGDKSIVQTKEQADHSLPYLIAAALLDGEVLPVQYSRERIARDDVQTLLRKVHVAPADDLSDRFPDEMPCRVRIRLKDSRELSIEKSDYLGFVTRPTDWPQAVEKFDRLTAQHVTPSLRKEMAEAVGTIEKWRIRDLMDLLRQVTVAAPVETLQYGGT